LALEAHVWLDHEMRTGFAQFLRECAPRVHIEHHAEVPHRHVVAVHVMRRRCMQFLRRDMRDDLMTEEIEIYPGVARSSFRAAEQAAVEAAGFAQRCDGKSEMEGRNFVHDGSPDSLHLHQYARKREGGAGVSLPLCLGS